MKIIGNGYYNYLVSFSDGTFKTGVTGNPFFRLQDFVQEAHRHSVKVNGFEITRPIRDKNLALKIESEFCKYFSHEAIAGHREWFKEDVSWMDDDYLKIHLSERDQTQEFKCRFYMLKDIRDKLAPFYVPPAKITIKEYLRNRWKIISKFQELQDLASELGKRGNRIKARLATRIANQMLSEVLQ